MAEFKELVSVADVMEADLLIGALNHGGVKYRLAPISETVAPFLLLYHTPTTVQVLDEDLPRAKALLNEYRKTQGVPFS
jgi:hypothetical protein